MKKIQDKKLSDAIARILNLRDVKKVMKNNEFGNKKRHQFRKFIHSDQLDYKFISSPSGNILITKNFNTSRPQIKNQKCQNCKKLAHYKQILPKTTSYTFFCSSECYQSLVN